MPNPVLSVALHSLLQAERGRRSQLVFERVHVVDLVAVLSDCLPQPREVDASAQKILGECFFAAGSVELLVDRERRIDAKSLGVLLPRLEELREQEPQLLVGETRVAQISRPRFRLNSARCSSDMNRDVRLTLRCLRG